MELLPFFMNWNVDADTLNNAVDYSSYINDEMMAETLYDAKVDPRNNNDKVTADKMGDALQSFDITCLK